MLNIAICEDRKQDSSLLKGLVEEYLRENNFQAKIDVYESGEAFLETFRCGGYQIIFLDIYLTGMTGMQTAHRIREQDAGVSLIFLTTSEAHAVESYTVQAAYYLKKPVTYPNLCLALKKCEPVIEEYNRHITVLSNRAPVAVLLRDILYAETYQRNSTIYTLTGEVKTAMTMDALEKLIQGRQFVRCHRSFLINMQKISRLSDKEIILVDGEKIPIGRAYGENFKRVYAAFALSLARARQVE